jgi:hypothetical protein
MSRPQAMMRINETHDYVCVAGGPERQRMIGAEFVPAHLEGPARIQVGHIFAAKPLEPGRIDDPAVVGVCFFFLFRLRERRV